FWRAAFAGEHSAEAEIAQTRAYMQGGEYRRALALAAHTAGGDPEAGAGGALDAPPPGLTRPKEIAPPALERPSQRAPPGAPVRFAPSSADPVALPQGARVASSGVLAGEGRTAFASASALRGADRVWVRNGLGAASAAVVLRAFPDHDLAVLLL